MKATIEELLRTVHIRELPRRRVSRVTATTTLGEVYRLLDDEHSVAVLVFDGDRMAGIFTERDVLYRTALEGDPETAIGDLMTDDPITLDEGRRLADAIRTMAERRIRHIPLGGTGEEGLIGGRDVLRLIADYYPESLINLPPRPDQTMPRPEGG